MNKQSYAIGDKIQIKGSWGFLYNPLLEVVDIKGETITVQSVNAQTGGSLSFMNQTRTSEEMLKRKSNY